MGNNDIDDVNNEVDTDIEEAEQAEVEVDTEKKFTQSEVNEIVKRRLNKERERITKSVIDKADENDLAERERNLEIREMKADVNEALSSYGLPARLAELVDYTDRKSADKSLKEIINIFNEVKNEAVKPFARQKTPKESNGQYNAPDKTREAFGL